MSALVHLPGPDAMTAQQIAEAERALINEEQELNAQLSRIETVAAGVAQRANDLNERARGLASQLPEARNVGDRLRSLPHVDVSDELAELQRIRSAAINARSAVHDALKQALARYAKQLDGIAADIDTDARALEHAAGNARVRAAEGPVDESPQRRAHTRVPVKAVVDYSSDTNFYRGFSIDISEGGVFIATFEPLAVGSVIDLTIVLPDEQEVRATGQVRWTREWNDMTPQMYPGIGIQFLKVEDDGAEHIKRFVDVRDPMFYAD
jgi:uncharacterized protein (TIGR02266 family)